MGARRLRVHTPPPVRRLLRWPQWAARVWNHQFGPWFYQCPSREADCSQGQSSQLLAGSKESTHLTKMRGWLFPHPLNRKTNELPQWSSAKGWERLLEGTVHILNRENWDSLSGAASRASRFAQSMDWAENCLGEPPMSNIFTWLVSISAANTSHSSEYRRKLDKAMVAAGISDKKNSQEEGNGCVWSFFRYIKCRYLFPSQVDHNSLH